MVRPPLTLSKPNTSLGSFGNGEPAAGTSLKKSIKAHPLQTKLGPGKNDKSGNPKRPVSPVLSSGAETVNVKDTGPFKPCSTELYTTFQERSKRSTTGKNSIV